MAKLSGLKIFICILLILILIIPFCFYFITIDGISMNFHIIDNQEICKYKQIIKSQKQLNTLDQLQNIDLKNETGICYFNSAIVLMFLDNYLVNFIININTKKDLSTCTGILYNIFTQMMIQTQNNELDLSVYIVLLHNLTKEKLFTLDEGGNSKDVIETLLNFMCSENTVGDFFFSKYQLKIEYFAKCKNCDTENIFSKNVFYLSAEFNFPENIEPNTISIDTEFTKKSCKQENCKNNIYQSSKIVFPITIILQRDNNFFLINNQHKKENFCVPISIKIKDMIYDLYAVEIFIYTEEGNHSYVVYKNKSDWYSYDNGVNSKTNENLELPIGHFFYLLFYTMRI